MQSPGNIEIDSETHHKPTKLDHPNTLRVANYRIQGAGGQSEVWVGVQAEEIGMNGCEIGCVIIALCSYSAAK